jgi:outer membrane protein assembly factor BamB
MGTTDRRRRVARVARTGTAVLLAVTLSGCWWQQIGSNGGQTRNNPLENQLTAANVDGLTLQWSTSAPGRLSEPVTDARRVYVTHSVSGTSAIRAYELATGSLVWDRALPNTGEPFEVTPPVVFSGEDLLVGHPARPNSGTTPCADLRRLDPSSGDTIALRTTRMVTSATVTSGSIVAHMDAGICDPVFLGDHRLVVRDQATLEILWTAKLDSLSNVPPTIADGRIYVNQAGTVLAYDAAGCGAPSCPPVWTSTDDGFAVNDPVVAAHGQVYLRRNFRVEVPPNGVFEYGRLEVLDANDGTLLWQAPYSAGTDPGDAGGVDEIAATEDRVYVVAGRNQGADTPFQRVLDAYPASGCGQAECTPEWSAPLDGSFLRLMIGGDVVYATDGATLVALAADGCGATRCRPLASVPVAVGVVQYMVVSGGRVLVVGWEADGSWTLAAFGVPGIK